MTTPDPETPRQLNGNLATGPTGAQERVGSAGRRKRRLRPQRKFFTRVFKR